MNKKLIALAVAGAFAVPAAAMADVEVYGKAHVSFGLIDDDAPKDGDSLQMQTNNSNIGFRGSEDLGGGLKAVYQAEVAMNWDGGDGVTGEGNGWGGGRNTFVGFSGDWGTAIAGRHDTPYKLSTGRMDPFSDTVADYNNIMGASVYADDANTTTAVSHDGRVSNALVYVSPDMNGFSFAAAYSANDGAIRDSGETPARDVQAFSIDGTFEQAMAQGSWFVTAAYQNVMELGRLNSGTIGTDAKFDDNVAYKLGGGATFGAFTFNLAWENIDAGGATNNQYERDGYFASGIYKAGATSFAVSYAAADDWDCTGCNDTGATQIAVGVNHAMSKATSIYAIYGQVDADKNSRGTTINANSPAGYHIGGVDSTYVGTTGALKDGTSSAFVVGVQHNFSSK